MVGRNISCLPLINSAGDSHETIPDGHAAPILVRHPLDLISRAGRSPEKIHRKDTCHHTTSLGTRIPLCRLCTSCIVANAHLSSYILLFFCSGIHHLLHFLTRNKFTLPS